MAFTPVLTMGESSEAAGVMPDRAGSYVHHDLYDDPALDLPLGSSPHRMLNSFYPAVAFRGVSIRSPPMHLEWIEEDNIMQRILGQSSRGGLRSLPSQDGAVDAALPCAPGLSLYPNMQILEGRGLASQMPVPRHFEAGESSRSRLKRSREHEADSEWGQPPLRRPRFSPSLDHPEGNTSSTRHHYDVYSTVFQEMSLPVDPHLRFYMYRLQNAKG